MDEISLNSAERTQICAFISKSEFYWISDLDAAIYTSTSGRNKPTMYRIVAQKMQEEFGIRLSDYSIYNLNDICNSNLEDKLLVRVAALCRKYADGPLPDGMAISISGLEMEKKVNDILEKANLPIRITSEGVKKTDDDSRAKLAEKFKVLRSNNQAEVDFNILSKNNPIAILFFDVDNFKVFNTKYTETVVDKHILVPLQELIRKIVEERGFAYSFGGDEFVIVLKNVRQKETMAFAERLQEEISAKKFSLMKDLINLTVSIGCALYPDNGKTYSDVLSKANTAENDAKKKGKNCIIFAE